MAARSKPNALECQKGTRTRKSKKGAKGDNKSRTSLGSEKEEETSSAKHSWTGRHFMYLTYHSTYFETGMGMRVADLMQWATEGNSLLHDMRLPTLAVLVARIRGRG